MHSCQLDHCQDRSENIHFQQRTPIQACFMFKAIPGSKSVCLTFYQKAGIEPLTEGIPLQCI